MDQQDLDQPDKKEEIVWDRVEQKFVLRTENRSQHDECVSELTGITHVHTDEGIIYYTKDGVKFVKY